MVRSWVESVDRCERRDGDRRPATRDEPVSSREYRRFDVNKKMADGKESVYRTF